MKLIVLLYLIMRSSAVPVNVLHETTENNQKQNNYLQKAEDFPKSHYDTFGNSFSSDDELFNFIDYNGKNSTSKLNFTTDEQNNILKTFDSVVELSKAGTNTTKFETATISNETTPIYEYENITTFSDGKSLIDPVSLGDNNSTSNRTARQDESDENNEDTDDSKPKENQDDNDEEEEEEEEDQNMITGLVSAFLGGLSKPDGSVDIEAITGLIGSLSTQNDDGTYDFNGLTELLMGFFGGGDDGGGSNFGAFIGGLLGAFIKGIANPPGAKGAGIFVGNLLGGVLPGLSAPAPTEEGDMQQPQKPLDSGGFLGGLLSSIFGNLGTLSGGSSGGGGGDNNMGGGNKFSLFKAIFQTVTSIFSSSSATH